MMGAKPSSGSRPRSYSHTDDAANAALAATVMRQFGPGPGIPSRPLNDQNVQYRARSSSIPAYMGSPRSFVNLNLPAIVRHSGQAASQDSDSSDDEAARNNIHPSSLPNIGVFQHPGIKCPVCSKSVRYDEMECHLVMCLTKPRIGYNVDVLTEDKGECVICLDDLLQGDTISRLPCLCIYHKACIDAWFEKSRSCPEHPND